MRAKALLDLLRSVEKQTFYPDEILIIDGSPDNQTESALAQNPFRNLNYHRVSPENRGLTRQRNFGIAQTGKTIEIICFLDDDTVLDPTYFEELIKTYQVFPDALGVGGYIANESEWVHVGEGYQAGPSEFYYDGYKRKDGSRYLLRKKLGLEPDQPPCFLPDCSHGRSVGFLPPSGKTYRVEQFMGGVSSFRRQVFDKMFFSTYFEGYGLYEDADFTLRLSELGTLYVNTKATLGHFHERSGRPNQFNYGKMVIRNGWYIWRVKYPHPSLKARFKWNAIALLLTFVRMGNVVSSTEKMAALTESLGRISGWFSLLYNAPKIQKA